MSRDLKDLKPILQVMADAALRDIKKLSITPLVVETYRELIRQMELYCKGRTVAECVKVGIPKSFAEKYCVKGSKVTWTLKSLHIERLAIDVIPQRKDKTGKWVAIWNAKDKETLKIIEIMGRYGFEAGANWTKNVDSPHFQVKGLVGNTVHKGNTTVYLTKAIQTHLNKKIGAGLVVDGIWGTKTTNAVNAFRKAKKYGSPSNGKLGVVALRALFA